MVHNAATAPSSDKTSSNHGDVSRRLSKNLPKNTPMKTHVAIDNPICEETDRARSMP